MIVEIPLNPRPETFTTTLSNVSYTLTTTYRDADNGGWILDIADGQGNALVCGIPLVTGADLLAQYAYLAIPGSLLVMNDGNNDAEPTFDSLGVTTHLYYAVPE